ncbi:MAG: aminoacyl-tRNA hydrolase [Candidatus Aminicenantes bacterium]|nr:aminoacyl-tRNA hydrolase [Candidatus Aminicenantes bacterium]
MWAVIGLGNPGRRYARTRHNVGARFVRSLAKEWGVRIRKKKMHAGVAEVRREEAELILVQPTTYMNRSGLAVRDVLEGYGIAPRQAVIVYDDLDIPLGQIRVRKDGSAGSHKGLRSVVEEIGTQSFPRIRVGIGPLDEGEDAARFVLSSFREEEMPLVENSLKKAREALALILGGRIEKAMNTFNQKQAAHKQASREMHH